MKYFLITLLLLPAIAVAQQDYPRDITLSWVNPSQYTDGSIIEPGDLESIRVECFRNNDGSAVFTDTRPDNGEGAAQSETYVGVIPQPGTYFCMAFAIVVDGTESDPSNQVQRKYIGKPLPPQSFD